MSTPPHPTKAPRRSNRKPKSTATPNGLPQRDAVSENELSQAHIQTKGAHLNSDAQSVRRPSQASAKKSNNAAAHRGSVSDHPQPEKSRATPIKQAYAGPTFHQSPAASALPLPSFYSKSVPSVDAVKPLPNAISEHKDEVKIVSPITEDSPTKRESTPLDFLFDAARQARDTPRGQSPSARSGHVSVRTGSPASKSPAPKDPESMFPFELDGATTPGEDGSSFATPYKDRMEALKVSRPASEGAQSLDENERKAKTDALKKFLMKSAASQQPTSSDFNNPFNARPPQSPHGLHPPPPQIRHRSGPSTPSYMQTYNGHGRGDQYFPQPPPFPNQNPYAHTSHHITSNLRNVYGATSEPEPAELSSDSAISPPRISTARKPSYPISPPSTSSGHSIMAPMRDPTPIHRSAPSNQQMEDDLRRVLKLDLTSRG